MERLLAFERSDHTEIIGTFGEVWQEIAHPEAPFTTPTESPGASHPDARRGRLRFFRNGLLADCLSLIPGERRLRVKRINMARPTIHETKDNTFRTGRWSGARPVRLLI